jgi:hypothetical protein
MLRGTVVNVTGNPRNRVMRPLSVALACMGMVTQVTAGYLDPNKDTGHTAIDVVTGLTELAWLAFFIAEAVFVGQHLFSIQTDNVPSAALYIENTDILGVLPGLAQATTSLASNDKMESSDKKDNKNMVHRVENAYILTSDTNIQWASQAHCILVGKYDTRSSMSLDNDRVLMQYGLKNLGPSVELNSHGLYLNYQQMADGPKLIFENNKIVLDVGPAAGWSGIKLTPTGGIELRAETIASSSMITIHPTDGITLQAGPPGAGSKMTIHPANGITLAVGESNSIGLDLVGLTEKVFCHNCQVELNHTTKALMLREEVEGVAMRKASMNLQQ